MRRRLSVLVAMVASAGGGFGCTYGDLRRINPEVPVLGLTVARGADLYSWVRSMGADEMISKDASLDEILAAVRLLLSG